MAIERWTPRRKVALLNDLATGRTTQEAVLRLYNVSPDEIAEWIRAYHHDGLPGLRTTRTQERRPRHFLRSPRSARRSPT